MTNKALALLDAFPLDRTDQGGLIEWTVGAAQIRLNLSDIDRLGCLLDWAEVKPAPAKELDIDPKTLERTFTYLGESLVLIEHAPNEGRAILRSARPFLEGSQIEYYELVVDRRAGLSLMRYTYDSVAHRRQPVVAHLTTHALGRLIDDLEQISGRTKTKAPPY